MQSESKYVNHDNKNIFLAGATGSVGRPLCKILVEDGWRVFGTTRSHEKVDDLRKLGVEPVVVDVFNEAALHEEVAKAKPGIVIHQLTDLPPALAPEQMVEGLKRNRRIREIGTRNLISAALAAGATSVDRAKYCIHLCAWPHAVSRRCAAEHKWRRVLAWHRRGCCQP